LNKQTFVMALKGGWSQPVCVILAVLLALFPLGCERSPSTQPVILHEPEQAAGNPTATQTLVIQTVDTSRTEEPAQPVETQTLPSQTQLAASTVPAITLTAVSEQSRQTRLVFPLQTANSWVYEYQAYSGDEQATWQIIDTMLDTLSSGPLFAVKVEREVRLTSGSPSQDFIDRPLSGTFWYVVDGAQVFRQEELDWSKIADAWLELVWPFPVSSCWYPEAGQRSDPAIPGRPGCLYARGPVMIQTQVGQLDRCYHLVTPYNNGNVQIDFCEQVGIVGGQFRHSGTPYGYKFILTAYSLQNQ
jgi:hypothetical protein